MSGGALAEKPASPPPARPDDYTARLLKYIPSEVVALYLMLDGIVRSSNVIGAVHWGVFLILFVLTPLYLWRVQQVKKTLQLVISALAFLVWVFAIGGPFALLSWYKPLYGALVLPLYTFSVPIVDPDLIGVLPTGKA